MSAPFTRIGKQVFANGFHYADAADETAAAHIVHVSNALPELHRAADAYFNAITNRKATEAAPALREALATGTTP